MVGVSFILGNLTYFFRCAQLRNDFYLSCFTETSQRKICLERLEYLYIDSHCAHISQLGYFLGLSSDVASLVLGKADSHHALENTNLYYLHLCI